MKVEANNYDLKATLLSGQLFRVKEEIDGSFTIVIKDRVINLKQDDNYIIVDSSNMDDIENVIKNYLDINTNYEEINKQFYNDVFLKDVITKCKGLHILNQDSFEMSISYIISQNNNVKRISKSVEKLSELFGEKVVFKNQSYYLFPKYSDIRDITMEDIFQIKIGFRDKYVIDFLNKYNCLKNIGNLSSDDAIEELCKINGIGIKVSSCILLFGYHRFDVFPIDTWVKKLFNINYGFDNVEEIIAYAKKEYKNYCGLILQYIFNASRNN